MTYGAFQTAVTRLEKRTSGVLMDGLNADTDNKIVETAAGVIPGVVVSRGTDPDSQIVLGVSTVVLGIVVRTGDANGALGSEVTNTPVYAQYEVANVLRRGYIWAYTTGVAFAGSEAISVVDATGVLKLGAAGVGETDLTNIVLETTMAAAGVALFRIKDEFGI